MIYDKEKIKILYQGIDTLVLGAHCNDEFYYATSFSKIKERLENAKQMAKLSRGFGEKFIKDDLNLGLGEWHISSKGANGYSYLLKNEDLFLSVSNSSFEFRKTYHLKIQFRSSFLLRLGHQKAYEIALKVIHKFLGIEPKIKVLRLDICTDVKGIKYEVSDFARFRTTRKITNYINEINDEEEENENKDEYKEHINEFFELDDKQSNRYFMRFNVFEGVSFGKNPAMFRIYNKTKEIRKKGYANLLYRIWQENGYESKRDKFVFRHECEFGRVAIKKFIPREYLDDEVAFIFENIQGFWAQGLKLCKWYDLSDKELKNIQSGTYSNVRMIYKRVDLNESRFNLWEKINTWCGKQIYKIIQKLGKSIAPNFEIAKTLFKSFVSVVYSNLAYDGAFFDVYSAVCEDLKKENSTIHEYGLLKVVDKFLNNEKLIQKREIENNEMINIFENHLLDFINLMDHGAYVAKKRAIEAVKIYNDKYKRIIQ